MANRIYADPTFYPVGTPAATDTVMTRTAGATNASFALGNLAGLSGLSVAANQSVYFNGTVWATYSVTSLGRDLLAASTQATQRSVIGAVGLSGAETIQDIKTFTGAQLRIQSDTPGFWLDETDGLYGTFCVHNTNVFRFQQRNTGFGSSLGDKFAIDYANSRVMSYYNFTPGTTNTFSIGQAGLVWTQVFATNTTISTSDARLKTDPRNMRPAEVAAFATIVRLPNVWRWLQRKEEEGWEARKHGGPTVQAAMAIMQANNLDPFEYSCFCYDEWDEEVDEEGNVTLEAGDRYSFRKEELLCLCMTAMAIQHDELEERVAQLESKLANN